MVQARYFRVERRVNGVTEATEITCKLLGHFVETHAVDVRKHTQDDHIRLVGGDLSKSVQF